MFRKFALVPLALAGVLLAGCKDDSKGTSSSTSTPSATPAAPAPPAGPSVVVPPTVSTTPVLPPVVLPPATGALTLPSTEPAATPATISPSTQPSSSATTPDSTAPTTSGSGDANTEARALLAQTQQDISAKNWDAAGTDLKKLQGLKDRVAPEVQDQIKKAQANLLASKAASLIPGGIGLPSTTTDPNK